MRILLVDDKDYQRKQIGDLLKQAGYEIIFAKNGNTGLTRLKKHSIDLVITDTKMPLLDGPAMVAEIKKSKYRDVPIIGMSSREQSRQLYENFWQKNEPIEILLNLIKN